MRFCDHPEHLQYGLGRIDGPRRLDADDYEAVVGPTVLPAEFTSNIPAPVLNQGSTPECEAYTAGNGKTITTYPLAVAQGLNPALWAWNENDLFSYAHGGSNGTTTALMEAALLNPGALATSGLYTNRRFPVDSCPNIYTLTGIQTAVVNSGFAGLAVSWYESWFSPVKGVLPAPSGGVAGGHIFSVRGFSTARKALWCQNSWGTGWSLGGFFWFPYAYMDSVPEAYTQIAKPLPIIKRTAVNYTPIAPVRVLDTRSNTGLSGPFVANSARKLIVVGGPVPANANAINGNLTVTQQTTQGYLAVTLVPINTPTTSTLNFPVNDNRANALAGAEVNTDGTISITYVSQTAGATAQVILDITGYYTP